MSFVFLILLVPVSARDISQLLINEPRQERFERPYDNFNSNNHRQNGFVNTNNYQQINAPNNRRINDERPFVNPPFERDHRKRQESVNYHGQNEFVNVNTADQFNMQNNRELIPNDNNRNDRSWNRQANQGHFQENLNNPEQFNTQRTRDIIPNNNNDRNDRNWNNTNQGRPHADFNNHGQKVAQNNRDIIPDNNRNDRTNAYPGSHNNAGVMSINLAFDRQGNQNRREQSNLNLPRQSFKINNEYSNRDDTNNRNINMNNHRNDNYSENILHTRRQQDKMTLGDYNRETQENHRSNPSVNQNSNNGIVSFLNSLNNTNQNRDNQNPNRNNQRHQSELINTDTAYKPKTAKDNEVTQNPLENGKVEKENESPDKWVWGVEETTTTMTPVTVDDRAAFSGDKCAKNLVRVMGKCVPED